MFCGISTHTLRKEGDLVGLRADESLNRISTHTLRKEGDNKQIVAYARPAISTHTLRKEGDS